MKFSELKSFVDVVEAGGMTQAAALRGISQPGLSRTIRDIETRLQTRLLRRTGRGVELTPEGAEFLDFARDALVRLNGIERRLKEMSGAVPDRLTIAVPSRVGGLAFAAIYRAFLQELPEVAITITEELSEEIADGLMSGRLDFAVTYVSPQSTAAPDYIEQLYLIGRPAVIGMSEQPIPISEVADLTILLNDRSQRYGRMVEAAFQAAGVRLEIAREIERAEGLLAFASEGEGVTILPYSNVHAEVTRGDVTARLISSPAIERGIYLQAARHLDPRAARTGLDIIRCAVGQFAAQARWQVPAATNPPIPV